MILQDDLKHHKRIFFCNLINYISAWCRAPMVVIIITMTADLFVKISFAEMRIAFNMFNFPTGMMLLHFIITVGFPGRFMISVIPVMGKSNAGTYKYQSRCSHYNLFNSSLHGFSPLFWLRF